MESLSLLKFWRRSTTHTLSGSDDVEDGIPDGYDAEEDDDGPFFDLEGLHPVDGDEEREEEEEEEEESERQKNSGSLLINLKVEEKPFASLFTRDNTSKIARQASSQMQRYLKKVKPLYLGVSKQRSHDGCGGGSVDPEPGSGIKVGFGVMCRHLGKSRSASAVVVSTPGPSAASSRRDDSLLQQQDGIQGAILHCKRSFNESRDR